MYDLVVIGGGTAGLASAVGAAGLGARVALIERDHLGGDCLMTGCVPSKAVLRSAKAVEQVRQAGSLGVRAEAQVDFAAVMTRMRARRQTIAVNDSAERLEGLGVAVIAGDAAFASPDTVVVNGRVLEFRRAVIATGARAAVPAIPGVEGVPYLTNASVFDLTECPARLVILGGGPVGCELAQAFALLGSRVTLIERGPRLLPKEDEDASAVLADRLLVSGVTIHTSANIDRVWSAGSDVHLSISGRDIVGDSLLLAVGRRPNVEGLALDRAGIATGPEGIEVDDHLRTSNRRVFAAGDVCSPIRFTHAADAAARIVIRNALFFGRARASDLVIPSCVYTSPEVAHVGARRDSLPAGARTITVQLADLDRAVVDDGTAGFVRCHHRDGRLIGATVVAPHAGEVIGLLGLCIREGMTLGQLSATVFPYPTLAEALRKAGDSHQRERLTPASRAWLGRYFSIFRHIS